jgi:hypothetical protein
VRNGVRCFRATGQDVYVRWCVVVITCFLGYNVGESSLGIVSLVWFFFLLACIGLNETARVAYARPANPEQPNRMQLASAWQPGLHLAPEPVAGD